MRLHHLHPSRLAGCIFICLSALISPLRAADEAKDVFDSLFAAKIKAVGATSDRADDVALAKELVTLAKSSTEQTGLLALLCDTAYDLGFRAADGYSTAIEAQQLLAEHVHDKREAARDKLVTLLTRQMVAGKADEREVAGESLIALLLTMGDEKFEKKQYAEAAGDYRRAVSVATQRKSSSLEEAKAKLEFAAARDKAVKNLARLQEKLLKDANDSATAEEIVKLYVVEFDDPAKALPFLNRVKDVDMERLIPLTAKPHEELSAKECLALGEWYISQYEGVAGYASMSRAHAYLSRFLELHSVKDLDRVKAEGLLKAVEAKRLSNNTTWPGISKSIDLLKQFDPAVDAVSGSWKKSQSAVQTPAAQRGRCILRTAPKGDYRLQVAFTRTQGDQTVALVLPVGTAQVLFFLDGWVDIGARTSLEFIDGKRAPDTDSIRGRAITTGRKHHLDVVVLTKGSNATITVKLDGKQLYSWSGRQASLSLEQAWSIGDSSALGLATWESAVDFHSVILTMLSGEAKALPMKK